jgi:hypothetical protein
MRRIAFLLSLALLAWAGPAAAHENRTGQDRAGELRADMRKLWEDHVAYTAFFYKAAIDGGDDAGKIAARLLRNQDDIGNAVKPFYGEEAGNKVAALLRDHILIAADLVKSAKAGDAAGQELANKKWYRNADDLAALLSSVNPHWPRKTLEGALRGHLQMVTEQVVATLHHDTAAAIAAYDKGADHMLMVADVLTTGIVKQFPARFRDRT